jgi:hypothetical protein
MPIVHLTARLRDSSCGRLDREHAAWLFSRVRHAFPHALGVVLMPNHPHLVVDVPDVEQAYATFRKILSALVRPLSWLRPVWQPIARPKIVVGAEKIAVEVRYVALNAPRARLADDPLAWYWSTHRDVLGATADPWVTFTKLRRYLPPRLGADVERWHRYVSSDPSCHVAGTSMPAPARDVDVAERPLADVLRAAAAATRGSIDGHRRRGSMRTIFVRLAAAQGWDDPRRLAELCDTTPRAIADILRRPPPPGLAAARLSLGDPRLLRGVADVQGQAARP